MTLREIAGLTEPGPEAWRAGFSLGFVLGGVVVGLIFLMAALVLTSPS